MQSLIKQQSIVAVDESTFTYLPKVSTAIGSSTLIMDQALSKKFKNYKRFGLFVHGLDPVAFNRKLDPLPNTCFNCLSKEHRLLDCPKPLICIFCCNCGRRYVRIDKCPRCSRVFWELAADARQWLISYIPGDQEEATDCSEKDWNEHMDDTDENTSRERDSSKRIKDDSMREELTKRESASALVSSTTYEDEGNNDGWWSGGKSKGKNVEEILAEKHKARVSSLKSPSAKGKNKSSEESFQNSHLLDNSRANSNFDNQVNSHGDNSSAALCSLECHSTSQMHVEGRDQEEATDCSEKDWNEYIDDTDENTSRESDSSKQIKDDSIRKELTKRESASALVSRTTYEDEGDNDDWWSGGKSKDENVEEILAEKYKAGVNSFKSPSTNGKNKPSKESFQNSHLLANSRASSNLDNQVNLHGDNSSTLCPLECHSTSQMHIEGRDMVTDCSKEDWSEYEDNMGDNISGETDSDKRERKDCLKPEELTKFEREYDSRITDKGKSDTDNLWAEDSNTEETVEERLNPVSEKEEDNHESTLVNERNRKDEENVETTLVKTGHGSENQFNLLDESSCATPSEEDEEDYDNIIVDEDQQLEESCVVGSTVRDFLDLLKAAKYLPLQQQNRIVLRFASECKKKC